MIRAAAAVLLASWVSSVQAAEIAPPGVLILYSNQRPTPAQVIIEDTLRAVVADGFKRPVEIFSEYLDDEWASLETYGAKQAEFLRDKYERRNVRVIVAVSIPALQFLARFRDRIAASVPVVHVLVARDRVDAATLPPAFLGNFEDNDPTPTLELALRLHPRATRLVVIRGASERDRLWDRRVRAAVENLGNGVEIEYLAGLPTTDVLGRVAALPPATIVFTPGYFVDGAGAVSTPRQSTERIAAVSVAPVYGTFDTLLGAGIVGGYMTPYEDQARDASAIVVRLLEGTAPAQIASLSVARVPMVDWRQVRRWGVDERRLPAETIVKFREPPVWDRYWREILAAFAILVLQAGLIAALLFERRRRRRTASALEESEKRMSLAANAAGLTMWIWDATRDAVWSTTRGHRPTDPPRNSQVHFDQALESVHPADREAVDRAARHALKRNEELDIECRVIRPDGNVRWIAARGRAEKSNHPRLVGVALDITARKQAELQAEKDRAALTHLTRVSMMGQLSASIAHQLNQPLAAILGNAEAARKMLAKERLDLVELREICDDIVTEESRAAEVIRRLGALFRRGEMKFAPLDLNELVRETLDLVRTELVTRHVVAVTDLAPSLPTIDGGRVQLQQVLLNLILNAADAMSAIEPMERTLTIRTELAGANVRLCVVDRGSGIAPEDIKSVFDAFWSTKAGGMGIGLAICQSIITAHRGTLTVANNPDRGATFCATWPVRQPS